MKRNLISILVAVAACSALIQWSSCGGSSSSTPTPDPATAPTITSVTTTGGNAQSLPTANTIDVSGTTNVSTHPTSFTVTFDTAMAPDTLTNSATGATLTCGGTDIPISLTPTSDANTAFTIAATSAPVTTTGLPQLANCIATFGTGIQNASGTALAEISYNFATSCSTSDDFSNADTVVASTGCWVAANGITATVDESANTLTISVLSPAAQTIYGLTKTIASGNTETISIQIPAVPTGDAACYLGLMDNSSFGTGALLVYASDGNVELATAGTAPAPGTAATAPITLTLTYDGSGSITPAYTSGGVTTTMDATSQLLGSSPTIVVGVGGSLGSPAECTVKTFTSTRSATNGPDGTSGGQD